MGLETGDFPIDLDENWPLGTDSPSQGDDHLRLIKHIMKTWGASVDEMALTDYFTRKDVAEAITAIWDFQVSPTVNGIDVMDKSTKRDYHYFTTTDPVLLGAYNPNAFLNWSTTGTVLLDCTQTTPGEAWYLRVSSNRPTFQLVIDIGGSGGGAFGWGTAKYPGSGNPNFQVDVYDVIQLWMLNSPVQSSVNPVLQMTGAGNWL